MGKAGDASIDKLIDAFRIVAVGAILIFAMYSIIESILSQVPIWIKYILYGLLVFFVYLMRDKVIEFTKNILK